MLITLTIVWVLTLSYVLLMIVYWTGWKMQRVFRVPANFTPDTRVSIIIPARNEEGNIAACLSAILRNSYPASLIEIIVIDDHSTDNTAAIVRNFDLPNVKCLSMANFLKPNESLNAYKKKALEIGIAHGTGELIVTTDADCIAPPEWLTNIAARFKKDDPVMIVGPVSFTNNGSLLETFQSLDFMSMQGITAAAHRLRLGNMSNGANLAFRRQAFHDVGGYKEIDHLASGDDFLLMVKMQRMFPGRIGYLKSRDAVVSTAPQPSWDSFFQQRIRWASKSGKYNDGTLTAILLLVYLFNLLILALFVASIWDLTYFMLGIVVITIKAVVEVFFLLPVAIFLKKVKEVFWLSLLQPLHIPYIVLAGFLGLIGDYKWKGRRVK